MCVYITLLSLFLVSGSSDAPFTLNLYVDGDSFCPMEPIYTKLVIKNTSNTVQKLVDVRGPGSQIDFLQYIIVDENGDTMPGLGQYLDYSPSILQLKPGDSLVCEMSLLDRYGKINQKDYDGYDIALWFIPPGRYTVAVRYEAKKDAWPKRDFWRGSVESNKVCFVVRELSEDLKEPFNRCAQIWTLLLNNKYHGNSVTSNAADSMVEDLINEFFATYKTTPYHPLVHLSLVSVYMHYIYYHRQNTQEFEKRYIATWKELFEKYSNSKLVQHKLADFGSIMKNRNRRNEWLSYLNYLAEKYPETRVGNEAKKLLDEERKLQK
ncbi:MAG: hypothetical protein ABIL74_10525 [candidate division WOR-3 bacterium]